MTGMESIKIGYALLPAILLFQMPAVIAFAFLGLRPSLRNVTLSLLLGAALAYALVHAVAISD